MYDYGPLTILVVFLLLLLVLSLLLLLFFAELFTVGGPTAVALTL